MSSSKEKQHQMQSTFLQQVADLTPDLLFVIDIKKLEIIYVNKRVEQLLGHDASYAYAKGIEIFKTVLHPDDYERRIANLEACRTLTGDGETAVEVRFKTSDGSWKWYRIRDRVFMRDTDGSVSQTVGIAQVIHAQKMADEKLQEERRRFKDAQAIGHIGSFERPLPGELVICSEEFLRIHGLELQPDSISVQQFLSLVHPDDQDAFVKAVHYTHATAEPLDLVNRIVRPDGSIRHVHRRSEIIRNSQGTPIRVWGTIQDITEQKRAEDALLKAQESLTIALEASQTGTWDLDLSRDFSGHRNLRHDQIFGYKEAQAQWGQQIAKRHVVEEDQEIFDAAFARARETGTLNFEVRVRWPDGSIHWMAVQGRFYFDENGKPIRAAGVNFDITERRKAEKQLEENAHFIRKVADTMPDILFVYDLERMRLQYINRDLASLLGKILKEPQSMDPEGLFSLLHPREKEAAYAYMQSFEEAADDEMKEVEFRIRNLKGEWLWFHCRGRVFKRNHDGRVVQFLSIMRDITAEKKTREALLEAERLSVKGTMARTIAHEVRGPAANISLSMEMLQKELGTTLKEKERAKACFDIVSKSCIRITDYINELISISATEPDAFAENDLALMVEEVLQQAQDRIFLKGIRIKRYFSKGYLINADRERLKIAILNIVMNAVEAMEEQKGVLQVSIRQDHDNVQLTIQDNGCGMTAEQLSKMFDVYYTSKPDGMGVGLASVQAILRDHEARTEVKSEPGKGTSFTVFFDKLS